MVIWSYLNVSNILIGGTAVPTRFCRCTMNRGKVHIQYPAKKEKRKVQTVLSGASAHSPFNRWLTCLVRSVTQPDPTLSGTRNDFCIIDAKQKSPALVVGVVWHWCRRAFMGGGKKSIETAAGCDRVIPKLSSHPFNIPPPGSESHKLTSRHGRSSAPPPPVGAELHSIAQQPKRRPSEIGQSKEFKSKNKRDESLSRPNCLAFNNHVNS